MIGLLEQIGEAEQQSAVKVEIKKHKFDDEDDLDIDGLDLWRK